MSTHRSFGNAKEDARLDPLTFDIAGEGFEIPRPLPAMPMLDLAQYASGDLDVATALRGFNEFLSVVLEGDYERFSKAARNARLGVEEFTEMVAWMMEELTGRPLAGAQQSFISSGSTESGPTSTATAQPSESIPSGSPPPSS